MDKQQILNIIKNRRKALKMTQKDMADKLGIEGSQYGRYELDKNEMTLEKFLQISFVLNLKLSDYEHELDDVKNDVIENLEHCIKRLKGLK